MPDHNIIIQWLHVQILFDQIIFGQIVSEHATYMYVICYYVCTYYVHTYMYVAVANGLSIYVAIKSLQTQITACVISSLQCDSFHCHSFL